MKIVPPGPEAVSHSPGSQLVCVAVDQLGWHKVTSPPLRDKYPHKDSYHAVRLPSQQSSMYGLCSATSLARFVTSNILQVMNLKSLPPRVCGQQWQQDGLRRGRPGSRPKNVQRCCQEVFTSRIDVSFDPADNGYGFFGKKQTHKK